MTFNELREARHQPVCSETRQRTDGQDPVPVAAPKKTRSQMPFQTLDALAHRAVGDVHLLGGVRKIQVSGSRFEEAKRLERRKYARHPEMIAALTADASSHRWPSSHQHSKIRICVD